MTIPCELCGTATTYLGTKRCNRCWELERRIESNPELAQKILSRILHTQIAGQVFEIPGYDDPNPTRDKIREWARAHLGVRPAEDRVHRVGVVGRCCPHCYRPVHEGPCK